MRIESIHLIMFAASMLVAAVYVGIPSVGGEGAALVIVGQGLMFFILGIRTGSARNFARRKFSRLR